MRKGYYINKPPNVRNEHWEVLFGMLGMSLF